jgi:hypothetical protein
VDERIQALEGINPNIPSPARMYDYYLGGRDNFQADREAAEKMIAIGRQMGNDARELARQNRGFLGRAVKALVDLGIRQFVDIGAGLPTQENVHQVAHRYAPDARIVYSDNDPIVLIHARALLAGDPETIVVGGDLREPLALLDHPQVAEHLDLSRPYAVLLAAVLHFVPDDAEAAGIVADLRERLPSGGYLAVSHLNAGDVSDELSERGARVYAKSSAGGLAQRGERQIRAYFDGLTLLEPGLVPVAAWRPESGPVTADLSRPGIAAAVARKD